jgi:dTDP-4-amino-4,6-dideoxygalactose transaminase
MPQVSSPRSGRQRQTARQIPLVRPRLPALAEYSAALERVWASQMLSNFASEAQQFEKMARAYIDHPNALAVSSCDVGLTLAVAALELPYEGEVILPSFTFNSTINCVLWNRLRPRFVDVDPLTFCLDPSAVEDSIGPTTALILGTHVFGMACDVGRLAAVSSAHGVPLLFDAAQAFATFVDDQHVSRFGDASVFSFSGTKIVTSGEGGLATFAEKTHADQFSYLRAYGFKDDYISRYVGLNGKLSEIHAALGCLNMAKIEDEVTARARIVASYRELLSDVPVRFQQSYGATRSSQTYFAVVVEHSRDELMRYLESEGVETKPYFRPLHTMPKLREYGGSPLPVTDQLGRTVLCLPLYSGLGADDVELVSFLVRDFFAAPS